MLVGSHEDIICYIKYSKLFNKYRGEMPKMALRS
jgi:hypothetical protein